MAIGRKIADLRTKANLTQEELANILHVSRQAVQKWEAGQANPDIKKLKAICEFFHVSLDYLIRDDSGHITDDELRFKEKCSPNYEIMHPWEVYSSNLQTEFMQLSEEGFDVEQYKKLVNEIQMLPPGKAREQMAEIVSELMHSTKIVEGYPYCEPSDLDGIKALRMESGIKPAEPEDPGSIKNRIKGAWLGRISGCLLGKPVEGISLEELTFILKSTGNYPLQRYIDLTDLTEEVISKCTFPIKDRCYKHPLSCAPIDDDTNYTVMAATKLIDVYGKGFQPVDVAKCWLASQYKDAYCTAERVAYINFVNGFVPPASAIHKNPFREWIGAQIRADYYGYICPGNPEMAAELAWRDASISHVKNGIYGAMFVAAMLACASVSSDIMNIIRAGLGEIPYTSRLYKDVSTIIDMHEKKHTFDDCIRWIHNKYDEKLLHHWCHTIPNALIVAAALLYGELDFGKSIGLAVQSGFDTDCNGATVGSIVGMVIGASGIPVKWTSAFNGKVETSIFSVGTVSVDELVDLTIKHIKLKN